MCGPVSERFSVWFLGGQARGELCDGAVHDRKIIVGDQGIIRVEVDGGLAAAGKRG